MLRQAPSRTAPPAPPKHTGLCPMPAHTCLGQEWESSPLAPPACFLGLGDRGVPLPRKSPDLQRVSDALNAERAWTCAGRAAPGSRPDSQGGDPAMPGDSEPTLGARPGLSLRTPGPVRGPGRGLAPDPRRARYPPVETGHPALSPRAAPGPHHVQSVAVRASGAASWPPSWAWGAGHPWSQPGAPARAWRPRWPASTASRPGPRSVHARAPHYRPQPAPPRQTCSLVTDWPPPPGLRARPDQGPSTALGAGLPDHTSPAEVPWFQAKQCRGLSRWPGMIVGRRGCLRGQRPSGDKVFGAVSSVRHLGLISVA